jgi:uncharacterized membrane protein
MTTLADPRPFRLPAILLGIGLGGFFDGIVFHQLLQWHHLVSTPVPPTSVENLQLNTLLDGAFHSLAWLVTVVAVALSWRAARSTRMPNWRYVVGGALAGWGGFNLVEGIVDHHLLELHHVRPGPDQLAWDLAFLGWGALMAAAGWWLMRHSPAVVQTGGVPTPRR